MNEHKRITKYCDIINALSFAFKPEGLIINYAKTDRDNADRLSNCLAMHFTSEDLLDKDGRRMQVEVELYQHLIGFDEVHVKFTSEECDVVRFSKCCDLESVLASNIGYFLQNCYTSFHEDGTADRWQFSAKKIAESTQL